jgi:hypothetical protein
MCQFSQHFSAGTACAEGFSGCPYNPYDISLTNRHAHFDRGSDPAQDIREGFEFHSGISGKLLMHC